MISEFPLFAFTTLTGLSAGALLAAALFPRKAPSARPWLFSLVMLMLIGIGAFASIMHLGRPQNMVYMVANPLSSLVLEGIFAGLTGLAVLVGLMLAITRKAENRAVMVIAAVFAVVLMCLQAYAYATSFGNAAWRGVSVWPFFICGSLGAGFVLWALFSDVGQKKSYVAASCGALVAAAVSFAWEALAFASVGAQYAPMICGAVLALAASAFANLGGSGKMKAGMIAASTLAVLALAIARYGFYGASII